MTKEELIQLLKEYKENKARLNLRLKELKIKRIQLKACDEIETSITASVGINQDIHSKNKISDKVAKRVEQNETRRQEIEEEIKVLEEKVKELRYKVEAVDDRLEGLAYKEKQLLTAYYVERRTYEDIGTNLYFELFKQTRDKDTIKRIVERAMVKILNL